MDFFTRLFGRLWQRGIGSAHTSSPGVSEALFKAVHTKETLRIRYHGGWQPGAVREIRPLSIAADRCIAIDVSGNGEEKTFRMDRIEFAHGEPITYDKRVVDPEITRRKARIESQVPSLLRDEHARPMDTFLLEGNGRFDFRVADSDDYRSSVVGLMERSGRKPSLRLGACGSNEEGPLVLVLPVDRFEILGRLDSDDSQRFHQSIVAVNQRNARAICRGQIDGERTYLRILLDLPKPTKLAKELGVQYRRVSY